MWPTYNESGLSARKKSDRASVHEQVRPDRAVHQLAATGSTLSSVKCFTKSQSHHNSQWVNLLATAFISVNAYFAQSPFLQKSVLQVFLCVELSTVLCNVDQRQILELAHARLSNDAESLRSVYYSASPQPAPWALLLLDVLENMFCPLFDLVAALPLLSPRSHTRLLKARGCKRAKQPKNVEVSKNCI